jgi:hypothetical protein
MARPAAPQQMAQPMPRQPMPRQQMIANAIRGAIR